jgi:coxsackievirus/adenovirus receptor
LRVTLNGSNVFLYFSSSANKTDEVEEIDSRLLEQLEQRLQDAEGELAAANLEQRLVTLKRSRETQQTWIRNYENEIDQLKKDVANIQEIRHAIPEKCFRRVRLEP